MPDRHTALGSKSSEAQYPSVKLDLCLQLTALDMCVSSCCHGTVMCPHLSLPQSSLVTGWITRAMSPMRTDSSCPVPAPTRARAPSRSQCREVRWGQWGQTTPGLNNWHRWSSSPTRWWVWRFRWKSAQRFVNTHFFFYRKKASETQDNKFSLWWIRLSINRKYLCFLQKSVD